MHETKQVRSIDRTKTRFVNFRPRKRRQTSRKGPIQIPWLSLPNGQVAQGLAGRAAVRRLEASCESS